MSGRTSNSSDIILAAAIGGTPSNSNTLTYTKEGRLLGNGVGQQDRVGAAALALVRTTIEVPTLEVIGDEIIMTTRLDRLKLEGAAAYSDSFFPYPDGIQVIQQAGIAALLSSWNTERHKDLLTEHAVNKGVNVAVAPDALVRGFGNH